jgi:hypothetical protein
MLDVSDNAYEANMKVTREDGQVTIEADHDAVELLMEGLKNRMMRLENRKQDMIMWDNENPKRGLNMVEVDREIVKTRDAIDRLQFGTC